MYLPNPLTTLSGDSDLREEIRMYSSSFVRKKSGRQLHTQTFSFDTGAREDREAVQGSHGRKRQQSQFPLSKSCSLCFAPVKPAMYAEKSIESTRWSRARTGTLTLAQKIPACSEDLTARCLAQLGFLVLDPDSETREADPESAEREFPPRVMNGGSEKKPR